MRLLCTVLLCSSLLFTSAHAVSSNTIREKYELQLSEDVTKIRSELLSVQQAIHTAREIEIYNSVVSSLSTEELDSKIDSLTSDMVDLQEKVVGGIDLPLEELLSCESAYYSTIADINTLLVLREGYDAELLQTGDEDLATLLRTESALKASLEEAGAYDDIGKLDFYPVRGQSYVVNSSFGARYDPVGLRGYTFHHGVDLKAPEGTPIDAWFSGTVVSTGYSYGLGNYVWLDHGWGVKSYYCHLSRIDVTEGQVVTQGTQIALSGNTGAYSTGPHLHLALYIDNTSVNPEMVLQ